MMNMRFATLALAGLAALAGLTGHARAAGSCEELAAEIADKLRANGVGTFELEILPAALAAGGKVVGSCDKGSKRIVYVRSGAPARAARAAAPASVPRTP